MSTHQKFHQKTNVIIWSPDDYDDGDGSGGGSDGFEYERKAKRKKNEKKIMAYRPYQHQLFW